MRVDIVTKEYPPEIYGGAGVHATELVKALRDMIDVRVRAFGAERDEEGTTAKGRLGMRLADDPQGQGVRVVQVEPGSPADRAELPPGTLLRQVGDQKVATSQEAAAALRSAKPGSMLLLRIQPPGSDVTLLRALPVPCLLYTSPSPRDS